MVRRVALLDPFEGAMLDTVRAAFEASGFDLIVVADRTDAAQAAALADADYAVPVNNPLSSRNLPPHDRLRLVHKWGAGFDTVDVEALAARSIPLLRTSGVNASYVAELAVALMIMTRRNLARADRSTRTGQWEGKRHWIESSSIIGKTVGLVGFGAVARAVAEALKPFGCTILKTRSSSHLGDDVVTLQELLERCDIVSLHAPLTAETRGLIGTKQFAMMKSSATLINTARGPIVDESALLAALRDGTIAGAGLDVFDAEPLPAGHPFLTLENLVLTPHLGGKVRENLNATVQHIIRNILRFEAGEPIAPEDILII